MRFRAIGVSFGWLAVGLGLGALSWALCPLLGDRIEPFDTGVGFLAGQVLMSTALVWIGYATGSWSKVALAVLGLYGGQVLYSAVAVGTTWLLLGLVTITALCVFPAVGGGLGVGIGKAARRRAGETR